MNHSTNHRDDKGRFMAGNTYAADGGRARAEKLSPARRRQIARAGFRALVNRRFDGDWELARRYVGEVGAWAGDAYRGTRWQHFAHPGSIEAFCSRWGEAGEAHRRGDGMTALSLWPSRLAVRWVGGLAFDSARNQRLVGRFCAAVRRERVRTRRLGCGCSTIRGIRTFVLEVNEMGDNPEMQEMQETTAPKQTGKLLTAEDILRTPDEAPTPATPPGRRGTVLNLDALIAERENDRQRGITVAELLDASAAREADVTALLTAVRNSQRAFMPDFSGMLAESLNALTPAAILASDIGQQAAEAQRFWGDMQTFGRVTDALIRSQVAEVRRFNDVMTTMAQSVMRNDWARSDLARLAQSTMHSIRNALIPLDTLRLPLQAPTWTGALDWERMERATRRAWIGKLGGNPDDPRWANIPTEQLAQWLDQLAQLAETKREMEQATGLKMTIKWRQVRRKGGRTPIVAYDLGEELIQSGLSPTAAFEKLVSEGVITPSGRSNFERLANQDDLLNRFNEAIKKRKQRR